MVERLTALDASFLYLEEPDTPMHVGGVLILQSPPGGLDHDRLLQLVRGRLPLVPRYRQRVLEVPGHLANPAWVDDPDFDLGYHVRRSGLPRPGTDEQLLDLVSRLVSRPLDRSRPLWEMYLVEGLADDRIALVTKTHPALVDGLAAVDIGQVILEATADPAAGQPDDWRPRRPPGPLALVWEALEEYVARPSAVLETARSAVTDVRATTGRMVGAAGNLLLAAAQTAVRPAPVSPLNAAIGRQRRVAIARADLDQLKRVRKAQGGTVNDVLLATVTGALREWLLSRGEPVVGSTSVRALVPLSVQPEETATANQVSSFLVDLPVGEPNPRVRLARISYAMRAVSQAGQGVGAENLVRLSGFAPPTLHALAARAASDLSRRLFNLVVTNVPGPQVPLYAAGARMLEVFPVVPLARGQGLAIGLTSYDGGVYIGLNADRDSIGDVHVLADLIEQEVANLAEGAR
ncbi:wax ester/triacylglycerol synthase family O-acyltransferase [Modestobacter sp. I12A-02628]|uniref:Diacylglycerol O-acyltransferase n=1 Tax=Goekera deserti TaxID=2497753 RepID=A0A7K3W7V7_9ACTN|nr:wax ester/triacylglycerol synthase family O-acyltransferase [Goekera deserti]MPQ99818.1 wax ester/triacylglycerol synthase family O-acyltransferase [Goekera deserti]NDI49975.1 wax ester/triacylglycerol synthase family O-acyltransferase [Goekera deserti]NEL52548.1 wax ester/triacylglycerol synthase family O-acyltransferase [Goekera deserti]